jgi:hypothetical protein
MAKVVSTAQVLQRLVSKVYGPFEGGFGTKRHSENHVEFHKKGLIHQGF